MHIYIYNCRFDQLYTSGNTENAAIFAKCKDANIILDVQKCYAIGGNYTIYALDSETAKVSGKVECVVGCSSRYEIANIADGVEQYDENHTQEFSEYPVGASWVKCYENDNLIRTQKLGE